MTDIDPVNIIVTLILGFLPISEVRGAIPYALIFGGNNSMATSIYVMTGVIANLLIAPIALSLLSIIEKIITDERFPAVLRKPYINIVETALKKASRMEKITFVSLVLIVGIPFPATGAWTGSLIAFLLRGDKKKAIAAISLGVLIASAIVYSVVYLGISILKTIFLL